MLTTDNLQFVEETCDRAALLVRGQMVAVRVAKEIVQRYPKQLGQEGSGP